MILAVIFVDQFPSIIGQFVQHNLNKINTIESFVSQILIILLNYILSKFVIFHLKKSIFSNNNLDNISNISAIGKNINTEYLKYNIIRSRDINNEITGSVAKF